jgi:hypothetical protein
LEDFSTEVPSYEFDRLRQNGAAGVVALTEHVTLVSLVVQGYGHVTFTSRSLSTSGEDGTYRKDGVQRWSIVGYQPPFYGVFSWTPSSPYFPTC